MRTRDKLLKSGCTNEFLQKVIVKQPKEDGTMILCSTCCGNIEQSKVNYSLITHYVSFNHFAPAYVVGHSGLRSVAVY
jgi:hypothetical protein